MDVKTISILTALPSFTPAALAITKLISASIEVGPMNRLCFTLYSDTTRLLNAVSREACDEHEDVEDVVVVVDVVDVDVDKDDDEVDDNVGGDSDRDSCGSCSSSSSFPCCCLR